MQTIYEPAGRAREYAELALNLFRGCPHGCRYCYVPQCLHVDRERFHAEVDLRPGVLSALAKALPRYRDDPRRVLLCFSGDPFPRGRPELHEATIEALEMLWENGQETATLTKNPWPAVKLVEAACRLMRHLPGLHDFGVSLSFADDGLAAEWEPGAAPPSERRMALGAARAAGLRTWISVEPVVTVSQALLVLEQTGPHVDEVRVGRLNYHPQGRETDWLAAARQIDRALASLRAQGVTTVMKQDLRKLL